jgi:hypothetical protein
LKNAPAILPHQLVPTSISANTRPSLRGTASRRPISPFAVPSGVSSIGSGAGRRSRTTASLVTIRGR